MLMLIQIHELIIHVTIYYHLLVLKGYNMFSRFNGYPVNDSHSVS